ncbi:MAG TPA: hypothetical protein VGR07_19715, partial [Thermoanaerobaculia bacterium]|nr:hypothetical protein [Thermoanaerobaculia bacterium]
MIKPDRIGTLLPVLAFAGLLASPAPCRLLAAQRAPRAPISPISIAVDATDAPRQVFHTHIVMAASPGPLTLYFPKWIPGEHGP